MLTDPPAPALTCERLLCESLATSLQPSRLRELLLEAEHRLPEHLAPAWPQFAADLEARCLTARGTPPRAIGAINATIADFAVRDRVRCFLQSARAADPVDALLDAELIAWLMRERFEEVLGDSNPRAPTRRRSAPH